MPEVKVASLNLRGIRDRWLWREPLVIRGLADLDADVICVQEAATWCLQARWVAWRLGRRSGAKYHVRQARKRGLRGVLEGVAVLSRAPIREHKALGLGSGRVALRVTLGSEGGGLRVVNTHFAHRSFDGPTRAAQSRMVVRWLEGAAGPVVLAGDLNDTPASDALRAFDGVLNAVHEAETLGGTAPAWVREKVIDYILVSADVTAGDVGTFLDAPVRGRWPSDHIGLWAKVRLPEG